MNTTILCEAQAILTQTYGASASFREGQYEAIEATLTRNRTLVVQKTGWGKSLVYFICTKIIRDRGRGMAPVVSPLPVLMEDQMEFARGMGLMCDALNSTLARGSDARNAVLERMRADQIDMLFITPETLMSDEVQAVLPDVRMRYVSRLCTAFGWVRTLR